MKGLFLTWQTWAVLSAGFAALTAILAKVGVQNINSDFATFVRTIVVLLALAVILLATQQFQRPDSVPARSYLFLVLSGLATGASWICYFRALNPSFLGQALKEHKIRGVSPKALQNRQTFAKVLI